MVPELAGHIEAKFWGSPIASLFTVVLISTMHDVSFFTISAFVATLYFSTSGQCLLIYRNQIKVNSNMADINCYRSSTKARRLTEDEWRLVKLKKLWFTSSHSVRLSTFRLVI